MNARQAYLPLLLIALFFAGAIVGRAIMECFASSISLYVEAGLLGVASFAPRYATPPMISLAMGIQNTALSTFTGVAANTSFLSADYTKLGQVIADVVLRRGTDRDRKTIAVLWPLVVAHAGGALIGAFCNNIPLRLLFVVPVVIALAFATQRKLLNPS